MAGLSAVSLRRFVVLVAVGRLPSWAFTAFATSDLMDRSVATVVSVGLIVTAVHLVGVWQLARLESLLIRRAPIEKRLGSRDTFL